MNDPRVDHPQHTYSMERKGAVLTPEVDAAAAVRDELAQAHPSFDKLKTIENTGSG